MKLLKSRLYEIEKAKQDAAIENSRKSQVGSGDRSEKIRTYNYSVDIRPKAVYKYPIKQNGTTSWFGAD